MVDLVHASGAIGVSGLVRLDVRGGQGNPHREDAGRAIAVDPQLTLRNNIAIDDEIRSDNGNVAIATLIADRMRSRDWRRESSSRRRLGLFEIW